MHTFIRMLNNAAANVRTVANMRASPRKIRFDVHTAAEGVVALASHAEGVMRQIVSLERLGGEWSLLRVAQSSL